MLSVHVTISGTTPLLVNRFHEDAQLESTTHIHSRKEIASPEQDAEDRLYLLQLETADKPQPYFPAENVRQALIAAGSRHKIGRKAASTDLAAAIFITPFALPLTGAWKVDSRPVVIPATRGRILRHRPIFEQWSITFTLQIDQELVDVSLVRRVLDDAGNYVGIGDFRPARKGPYGRFSCSRWEPQD